MSMNASERAQVAALNALLRAEGLAYEARLNRSDDPTVEDDDFQFVVPGTEAAASVSIQINAQGGRTMYCVNEYAYDADGELESVTDHYCGAFKTAAAKAVAILKERAHV